MKKPRVPSVMFYVFILCTLILININHVTAQTVSTTKADIEEEASLTWNDTQTKAKETQSVSFSAKTMTLTSVSNLPGGQEVIQTTFIPFDQIDTSRTNSLQYNVVEGMYFLQIFTKNNQKVVKTTTVFNNEDGSQTENVAYTNYFTIYSSSKDRNTALKDKIEHLVSISGE